MNKKIHKIIFVFFVLVIMSMAFLLAQYNASEWVVYIIGFTLLVLTPLLIWRSHYKAVKSSPTAGAVFEGAVLWFNRLGSSLEKRGRFLYRDDKLQLLSKNNDVVFSVSLDEARVYSHFDTHVFGYVWLSVRFGSSKFVLLLIPPSYKETVIEWDNAVHSNTGKHLISSGPEPKNT